jgi:hypothetical protein
VLKKAGIVVAVATAGLLAVSPLAFAGDRGDDHRGDNNSNSSRFDVDLDQEQTNAADTSDRSEGLINISNNDIGLSALNCTANIALGGAGAGTALGGASTVAGAGQTLAGLLGLVTGTQSATGTGGGALGAGEGGYAGNECDASGEYGDSTVQGNSR